MVKTDKNMSGSTETEREIDAELRAKIAENKDKAHKYQQSFTGKENISRLQSDGKPVKTAEGLKIGKTALKDSTGYKVFRVMNTVILIIISAATLYPFLYLVAQSFSSEDAIVKGIVSIFPIGFNLTTYKSVLMDGDFIKFYGNTIFYSVLGTFLSLTLSTFLAYPLSKQSLKANRFLTPFIIFTMYFAAGLIPTYVLMLNLGLKNSIWGFIFPGLISTYYILLMKSFFVGIPKELEEAGELDGLSKVGVLFRVVLPLSKPIIATMALFYMVGYWNNWFNAFLYLKREQWPVAYYLRTIIQGASTTADPQHVSEQSMQIAANIKSCAMVLMVVPIICLYPIVQKYYVQGMMLGGVKE